MIFGALALSLSLNVMSGVEGSTEAIQLINQKKANTSSDKKAIDFYSIVRLVPEKSALYPDTLYNAKEKTWIPVQLNEITTKITKKSSKGLLVFILVSLLIMLGAMICAFISFFKLIRNINASHIFEWANVKNLRWVGSSFLVIFVVNIIFGYFNYQSIVEQISIPNYTIDWSNILQVTNLVIGLVALLVAEIFSIGLKLQEEQDLTI